MFSKVMKLLGVMDEIAAQRQVPLSQIAINWAAPEALYFLLHRGRADPQKDRGKLRLL